jgi:N6-L-threonylcarbamoyladenine synthase
VLGIESSFNDTSAAVVRGTGEILSNQVATWTDKYRLESAPSRAEDHHKLNLPLVVEAALAESGKVMSQFKCIAVTQGPGQIKSLKVGLDFAQALGLKFNLPVVPVNHIEAHVMTPRMLPQLQSQADFPYLAVLATGAHTEIVLTRGVGLHTIMGFSIDIGIGTFLDQIANEIGQRKDILGDK